MSKEAVGGKNLVVFEFLTAENVQVVSPGTVRTSWDWNLWCSAAYRVY